MKKQACAGTYVDPTFHFNLLQEDSQLVTVAQFSFNNAKTI